MNVVVEHPEQSEAADVHPLLRLRKRYYVPSEVASIADMSVSWVYQQIHAGKIRATRIGARLKVPYREAERIDRQLRNGTPEGEGGETDDPTASRTNR